MRCGSRMSREVQLPAYGGLRYDAERLPGACPSGFTPGCVQTTRLRRAPGLDMCVDRPRTLPKRPRIYTPPGLPQYVAGRYNTGL